MADLYKGIAGSPITYLAADISANQTTISIADDSALPDAPNIATIGYGENLETIKYGVKSNGVLQNVTRGIEGTPRAWPAGTEVARFFTAYDHNSIIEDFVAHKAENASKHITESGSNPNGSYIKFDDGTLICYNHGISLPRVDINICQADVILPHISYDNNYSVSAYFESLTSTQVDPTKLAQCYATTKRTSAFYLRQMSMVGYPFAPTDIVYVGYILIGRWKA